MRLKTLTCILLGLSFVLSCGSTKDGPEKTAEPRNETGTVEVEDREGFSVKGVVLAGGEPVAGAMVSDGVNVTQTDFDGKYWLRSTTGEDLVWLSVPSGYEVSVNNGWAPQFWHRLDQTKLASGEVQRFDFSLKAVNQDRFSLCVFTDVHIRGRNELSGVSTVNGERDSVQFRRFFLPKVQAWSREHAGVPHYALVLGDMIQDYAVTDYKTGLPEYRACLRGLDFPVFHIPGNHDYTKETFTQNTWEDDEARGAKQYYIDNLGPTYYSFSIGKVHFVMLDGTRVEGGALNSYKNLVSPRQMAWLAKDLAHVSKDMHLVICCHQPFYLWKGGTGSTSGCVTNRADIISVAAGFGEVTILSGHTHYGDIANLNVNGVKVNQYTHPAVCGPFWLHHVNYDGSPNGFTSYEFNGTSYTRRQCTMDDDYDYRAILYTDYTDTDGTKQIIINVPSFEDGWTLKVLENNVQVGQPVRTQMKDPGYDAIYTSKKFPSNTYTRESSHIWKYTPVNKDALFKMVVTTPENEEITLEGRIQ